MLFRLSSTTQKERNKREASSLANNTEKKPELSEHKASCKSKCESEESSRRKSVDKNKIYVKKSSEIICLLANIVLNTQTRTFGMMRWKMFIDSKSLKCHRATLRDRQAEKLSSRKRRRKKIVTSAEFTNCHTSFVVVDVERHSSSEYNLIKWWNELVAFESDMEEKLIKFTYHERRRSQKKNRTRWHKVELWVCRTTTTT